MYEINFSTLAILKKDDLRTLLYSLKEFGEVPKDLKKANLRTMQIWANASSLIDGNILTEIGELAIAKDPYLEATVTDWLIHFQLYFGGFETFSYFIRDFLPTNSRILLDEIPENLKKAIRLFTRMYSDPQAIAKCRFLNKNGNSFSTGNPDLSNPFIIGYLLAEIWDRNFSSQRSLTVGDVLSVDFGMTTILGINVEELRLQLDNIAKQEIIEQRSLKPYSTDGKPSRRESTELNYQIFPCWDSPLDLLKTAYENDSATPNQPLIRVLDGIMEDVEVPDFSQFLEWVSKLNPKQVLTLIKTVPFQSLLAS